jgi:hypothetical protein
MSIAVQTIDRESWLACDGAGMSAIKNSAAAMSRAK